MGGINRETTITISLALVLLAGMFYLGVKVQTLDSMDKRLANLEQSWTRFLESKLSLK